MNATAPDSGRSLSTIKESANPAVSPANAPTIGINPMPAEAKTRTVLPFELWTNDESRDRIPATRSVISSSEAVNRGYPMSKLSALAGLSNFQESSDVDFLSISNTKFREATYSENPPKLCFRQGGITGLR